MRIEAAFVSRALEIGLAQTIGQSLKEVERAIADLPGGADADRHRRRLEDQRAALRNRSLRNTAALVAAMCAKDPALTPKIRRAFADLAERHPELAWFYAQLPSGPPIADLRQAS